MMKNDKASRRRRMIKYNQKRLNQQFAYLFIMNCIIVFIIMLSALVIQADVSGKNKSEGGNIGTVHESTIDDHDAIIPPANASTNENGMALLENETEEFNRGLSQNDKYLLARIAMAEADGESLETKVMIILVVLNRVESNQFPNTVEEVIFQESNGVYQFTPIANGRWDRVEPNDECWEAVEIVNSTNIDFSNGALYFEACENEDNWHSRNLEFVCKSGDTRFYR